MSRIVTAQQKLCREFLGKLFQYYAYNNYKTTGTATLCCCTRKIHLNTSATELLGRPWARDRQSTSSCVLRTPIRSFGSKKPRKKGKNEKLKVLQDPVAEIPNLSSCDASRGESENLIPLPKDPFNFISHGISRPYDTDLGILNFSTREAVAMGHFSPDLEYNPEDHEAHEDATEDIMDIVKTLKTEDLNDDDVSTGKVETRKKKVKKKAGLNLKERDILAKVKSEELDRIAKELSIKQNLSAYLDVCVNTNAVNRAYSTLVHYRNRGVRIKNLPEIRDVGIYNIVLSGVAENGNWGKIISLRKLMSEDGISPNLETFAANLLCFSYMEKVNASDISEIMREITGEGLNLSDIFTQCSLPGDHYARILKVIRVVSPNFTPGVVHVPTNYNCKLLDRLNEDSHEIKYTPGENKVERDLLRRGFDEQLRCELSGQVTIKSVKNVTLDKKTLDARTQLSTYETNWRSILMKSFGKNVKELQRESSQSKYVNIYPYLMALEPKIYVDIMCQEVRQLCESSETYSQSAAYLHVHAGLKAMSRYMVQKRLKNKIVDKISLMYDEYCKYYASEDFASKHTPREYWQNILSDNQSGPNIDVEEQMWPLEILAGVGKFLHGIILSDVKIFRDGRQIPAFYSIYRNSSFHMKEEVKPHPYLAKLYKCASLEDLTFENAVTPMLSPPLPWYSVRTGGLILSSAKIIRLPPGASVQKQRIESVPSQQLYPVFDVLNQLGECPWIINKEILDLVIEVFNNNGNDKLEIPAPPSQCPLPPSFTPEMTWQEKSEAARIRSSLKRRKGEMYSLWCDALYKYSIANHFRDRVFWFPHNLDFRGRVYPCPPHFNHLGSDVTRGMLMFANGKCLGENGLKWLKIHVVNLTGLKKRSSLAERLKYADGKMEEILDSADKPLSGRKWWMDSDEPWQTLAGCKEIAKAVRSTDPAKYVCHLAVHQDGSCNGLQHYAALGRDQHGAEQVNLTPTDAPQDVYSGVLALVEAERAKDAANGVKIAQVLDGFVQRKVIKQTVMTTVYGVTRYGARNQITRQLNDIPEFPERQVWAASGYLASKTFNGLHKLFTASKEIQDWFADCARLISLVCSQPVEWVTPLGLPVVQPYYKTSKIPRANENRAEKKKKRDYACINPERPNTMKQKNAFPPNFIHSLDSTHMMLTALFCRRAGITFVSVHDCFWTHPSSVEIMNTVCREQFVALHNEPILANLSKFLLAKYSYSHQDGEKDEPDIDEIKRKVNRILSHVPKTGKFRLEDVLNSTYFFS